MTKRASLSRERVLDAAVALADREGVEALSMRALGAALGVQAMSLYRYVATKDELLDALVERVIAEVPLPTPGAPWKDALRDRARSLHAAFVRHPWACVLVMSRINVGPEMLRRIDATIGVLRDAGFSIALADHAWNALDSFVYGFTLQTQHFPLDADSYREAAAAYLPLLSPHTHPHLHAMTEAVATGAHDGRNDLGFGLELLLDGLERLRDRGLTSIPHPAPTPAPGR